MTVTYNGNAWAPTNAGVYVVTGLVASGHAMYQGTSVVTLTVNAPAVITTPPQSLTKNQGASASFTVAVSGAAPLHYQWRRNGENAPDSPDAAAWTLGNVTAGQAGAYSVVVSDSHSDSAESGMAILKVESNVPAAGMLGLAALAGALALAGRRRRGVRR